jgi:hypothetical protein
LWEFEMLVRLVIFTILASHAPFATAQSSADTPTPFWRTCMLTRFYERMVDDATTLKNSATKCRADLDTVQNELKRAKADLETARQEKLAATAEWEAKLKSALRGSSMAFRAIKSSRASECGAVVAQAFTASTALTSVTTAGTSVVRGRSSTCGALAWCSSARDKDGDPYLIVSANCTDGGETALVNELAKAADALR